MIIVNARFLTQTVTGVQRFAVELSKRLKSLDARFVFVTPNNIIDKDLAKELGAIVIGKHTGTIWEQVDLRFFLISKHKPLLINFCNTGLLFYNRQIVTIHDMSYKVNPLWFSKSFYLWYNFLIPQIAKRSLKIFTVSNSAKADLIQYLKVKKNKISVIYNSYNLNTNSNFEPVNNEKYILTISSLEPRKNLNTLIGSFNQIKDELKLVIVGLSNDNYKLNIEAINKSIDVKGYVSDNELISLIKRAEAFVYISCYEGFGLPPIEAMGLNCPVIVSDIAAHREVCGNAALYVNPNSTDDIKSKIELLLSDNKLRKELIAKGKENIKRFDWFNSAKQVVASINEIV